MIKIFPMVANAMLLKHPTAGALKAEGSDWPEDGYTFRMMSDGAVTEDSAKAWKKEHDSEHAHDGAQHAPPEPGQAGPSPDAPGARDTREPPDGIVRASPDGGTIQEQHE
jgi:hypothetical protein